MTFEIYIKDNYDRLHREFYSFCHNKYNNRIVDVDIEDIFNDSMLLVTLSKSSIEGRILDYNGYIWIVLRNNIIKFIKDAQNKFNKSIVSLDEEIPKDFNNTRLHVLFFSFLQYVIVMEDPSQFFIDEGFNKLIIKSKTILDHLEYKVFINYVYNKITLRDISTIVGYSHVTVYKKKKSAMDKIKLEINVNRKEYFG